LDRADEDLDHAASSPFSAWDYAERLSAIDALLRGHCVDTPHNRALHIMSNMGKAVGESLIEAFGEETSLTSRLNEVEVGVPNAALSAAEFHSVATNWEASNGPLGMAVLHNERGPA
jgi:hypothetical protein